MTCKYNYKNISLKTDTYLDLQEISKEVSPKEPLSPAKTIDNLVYMYKSLLPKKVVIMTRIKSKSKKELQQEIKDLTVITTIQEDYIDLAEVKTKEFYDKHIEYAMGYWELWAKYENQLEDLHKKYNEIVRAYNALAELGKYAEELGIDIKKHTERLPEYDLYKDFKIENKVMESGKVKTIFSAKKIKKEKTNVKK